MSAATTEGVLDLALPELSDGMQDGTVLKWLVAAGQSVAAGADLVEIETDKASLTWPSPGDGFFEPLVAEGETVAVGVVIARLHESAASIGQAPAPSAADAPAASSAPAPAPPAPAPPTAATAATGAAPAPPAQGRAGRAQASPLARRIAHEHGLDLATVTGTARRGRIVQSDVLAAVTGPPNPPVAALAPAPAPTPSRAAVTDRGTGLPDIHQLTRTEALIADRMTETKSTIPEFALAIEVEMDAALAMREQLRGDDAPLPSVNDIVVKACALALRKHPRVNAAFRDGAFELYPRVNVGIAVAAGESLVVPTVFDADVLTLSEIAAETRRLAESVRSGAIAPAELAGGTFTISNLGMYGVSSLVPVLHGGQAAILGVGAAIPRMVPDDRGEAVARRIAQLNFTGDHRILYGAHAAAFLADVRDLLQAPARVQR